MEFTVLRIRRADCAPSLYPLKLALTSPTSSGRLVGIARSRTEATELLIAVFVVWLPEWWELGLRVEGYVAFVGRGTRYEYKDWGLSLYP
jgi:hypothetical protein